MDQQENKLNQDIFFKKKPSKNKNAAATSQKAPNAPTVAVNAVGSDANSKWARNTDQSNQIRSIYGIQLLMRT